MGDLRCLSLRWINTSVNTSMPRIQSVSGQAPVQWDFVLIWSHTHTQKQESLDFYSTWKEQDLGWKSPIVNLGPKKKKKYRKIVWTQYNNLSFPCNRKTCLCPLFLPTDLSSGTTSPSILCFKTPNGASKWRVTSLLSMPVLSGTELC